VHSKEHRRMRLPRWRTIQVHCQVRATLSERATLSSRRGLSSLSSRAAPLRITTELG
jgi:hypothetical protein